MRTLKYKLFCLTVITLLTGVGCKKIIEVDPPTNELTKEKVLLDSATANAAMVNPYALLEQRIAPDLGKFLSVYTDELTATANNQEYNESRLNGLTTINYNVWGFLYQVIYQCNDLLEQLNKPSPLSSSQVKSMIGEASFLRAFSYFYLVNLYDKVPLILVTDVNQTRRALQSGQGSVYQIILSDLKLAKENLSATYIGTGKVRANKWAASALLARVYLYRKEFAMAEKEAGEVIDCGLYSPLNSITEVYKAGSKENILQLWNSKGYVMDATDLLPPQPNAAPNFLVTTNLYNSFEANDLRKINWMGTVTETSGSTTTTYHYLSKYKNNATSSSTPEYLSVLRLPEQYLIRAEARAWQGKIAAALADINIVRNRAGLSNIENSDQTGLIVAIETERRHEMIADWGDRFINLKRTGRLNEIMFAYKPTWQVTCGTLPIPQLEITYNSNLIQNPGY